MSHLPSCSDCGWRGKATSSQAMAEKSLRAHSCEKYRQLVARLARGQAARAAVDRTPQPCLHKRAQHEHGSRACYVLDRCRCWPCSKANAEKSNTRRRRRGYGTWQPFVEAQPVREHLEVLADAGIGLKTVAKRSGIGHGTLSKLVYGVDKGSGKRTRTARLRPETAAAILAVQPDPSNVADHALVSAIGVHRRLQALVAAGWSQAKLGDRLGIQRGNFTGLMRRPRCTAETVRRVTALYDELAQVPPPESEWRDRIAASRARNFAAARGWQLPAWWDEEWLDDASFHPSFLGPEPGSHEAVDDVVVERACAGQPTERMTIAERREVVRRLHARRMSDGQIADRSGLADKTVLRIRQELGLPAIEAVA